jgi:hypothetical protein
MDIYQIIYCSNSTKRFAEGELERLMSQSRIHNYSESITGMLCYDGQQFLQVLEGPQPAIEQLYAIICQDARHTDVTTVFRGAIRERVFGKWSMGLSYAATEALTRLVGYLNPLHQAALLPRGYDTREVITDLLGEFVAEYPPLTSSGYYHYA